VHETIHLIPKCRDPDLWWQADEVKKIRSACSNLVKDSLAGSAGAGLTKATTKYLQRGWKEDRRGGRSLLMHMSTNMEIRGLEHSVIPVCRSVVRDHARAILRAQKTKSQSLRAAAKETSQACSHLAVERARHDTTQALKATLSRWTAAAVCVD
jgi:hypothetical protein